MKLVPSSKHILTRLWKTDHLRLHRKKKFFCDPYKIQKYVLWTEHRIFTVALGGTWRNHWDLKWHKEGPSLKPIQKTGIFTVLHMPASNFPLLECRREGGAVCTVQ